MQACRATPGRFGRGRPLRSCGSRSRKNFLSRRALLLYLIAGAPLVLLSMLAAVSAADGRVRELRAAEPGVCGYIRRADPADARLFWLCVGLYEFVPRRGGRPEPALLFPRLRSDARCCSSVNICRGSIATIVLFSITTVGSMLILYFWLFPSESLAYFFDGAGARSAADLPRRDDSGVHRLRGGVPDRSGCFSATR